MITITIVIQRLIGIIIILASLTANHALKLLHQMHYMRKSISPHTTGNMDYTLSLRSFRLMEGSHRRICSQLLATNEEYSNAVAKFLETFIRKKQDFSAIATIDWTAPKRRIESIESLVAQIAPSLCAREWFVTGNIDPTFFSDDFVFEDPDVKVKGVREYALGVRKIFDQTVSRAEIVQVDINRGGPENSFTVTWRLSGRVNIGFGLNIKPYLVFTDFVVSPTDLLIVSQVDRFSIPGYDILLSALFPFLIPFLSPPAESPSVDSKKILH